MSRTTLRRLVIGILLAALFALSVNLALDRALPDLGWPDEWIYLTLARNILERGSLNTNYYIASSIEAIGYPHRDVHLPGYALALATASAVDGFTLKSAIALNVLSFAFTVLGTFLLALRFLSFERSAVAAALVTMAPPFPGYIAIAYPEHLTAAVTVMLVAAAAWTEGGARLVALGFLLGVSLLFRETSLFLFPLFAALVGLRKTVRFVLPGFVLALATVLPPLSAKRAIHPNALYPSVLTEALKRPDPVSSLLGTLWSNAQENLALLLGSNPLERAEDALLLLLLGLAITGALASLQGHLETARLLRGASVSAAALFAAMIVIYVVRERGGVWGGVRALMPMAPIFIAGLVGIRIRPAVGGALLASALALFVSLDLRQIAFFNRYKAVNLEDQERAATFIEQRTKRLVPRRVVGGRYFQWAYRNYPAEVVWSGVNDVSSLNRLYAKFPFDFVVLHRRSPMRFDLRKDERYEWVNADEGQAAEYQIYRRVAP